MINKNTVSIKLDDKTIKKLTTLKYFKKIDNMTIFCKKALKEAIDKEFKNLQEIIKNKGE